jgi:PhnB protein
MMKIEPYLFFDGRCEEAIEFYKKAIGVDEARVIRVKDSPEPPPPGMNVPGEKIMHASLVIGSTTLMMSDGHAQGNPTFKGFSISLTVASDAEAAKKFAALAEGGKVTMPISKTFFSSSFGMLTDRFGVGWMVIVG